MSPSLPIGSSLTLVQDLADQVEVLVLLVYRRRPHVFLGPKVGTRPKKNMRYQGEIRGADKHPEFGRGREKG